MAKGSDRGNIGLRQVTSVLMTGVVFYNGQKRVKRIVLLVFRRVDGKIIYMIFIIMTDIKAVL